MVVTSEPLAWTAKPRHDRTATPSMMTVQAPHTPCSQPRWVPVRLQSSRSQSARVFRASTEPLRAWPLTVTDRSATTGLLESLGEGTGDEHGSHLLAVRARRVDVGRRIEVGDGRLTGSLEVARPTGGAGDGGFGARRPHRRAVHAEQGDGRPLDRVAVELAPGHHSGNGEVAVPAGQLLDAEAGGARPGRERHRR